MRNGFLATAFVALVGAGTIFAQGESPRPGLPTGYGLPTSRSPRPSGEIADPKPVYKYELKPEHGEFLVVVKTFRGADAGDERSRLRPEGGKARDLAEGLAEYIRAELRLYAFVHESGWAMRQERAKEKEIVVNAKRDWLIKEKGIAADQITPQMLEVKMARIPDEYTVFVAPGKGSLKNMDEALEFAKYIRKQQAPPADFCDAVMVGTERDIARKQGDKINPFLQVFAGRNPTLPKKEVAVAERPKADDLTMTLNSGKPYSLIHKTTKPFTLVVKVYGSSISGKVLKPGEMMQTGGKVDGEMLERAAQQAQAVATVLRQMDYDAYVLHTRYESFVTIGEYDRKDDPKLLMLQEKLAGQPLKDKKTGQVIETFMEKPMPGIIPRP